jgi:dihydroneopterin aldolase
MRANTFWKNLRYRILISDLIVRCIISVRDEERREKQDVLINILLANSIEFCDLTNG